jgi:CRISPR-associated protein Csx3
MKAWLSDSVALRRLDIGSCSVLLYPADELEAGPANLFLRRRTAAGREVVALLGPGSPSTVGLTAAGPLVTGRWQELEYQVRFRLAEAVPAWYWHVSVTNRGADAALVDVVHAQDVALASRKAVRTNEYYVSQYLDLTPVQTDEVGTALAVRQNMPGATNPWVLVGSLGHGTGWGTDALQLMGHGRGRAGILDGLQGELPSVRLQHEHTLALLGDQMAVLARHETIRTGFFGIFHPDHPAATSAGDKAAATDALRQPEAQTPFAAEYPERLSVATSTARTVPQTLFSSAPALACRPIEEDALFALAGPGRRHVERNGDVLLSFFTDGGCHVVTAAKEAAVLRPHGHILRTGASLLPDQASLTSTSWMAGTFHSQVTQGHVARNSVVSACRSYLGLKQATGVRVFVRATDDDDWLILGEPSAWAVDPDRCRWWYQYEGGLIEVVSTAPADVHELGLTVRVLAGPPCQLLVGANVTFGANRHEAEPPGLRVTATDVTVSPRAGSAEQKRFPQGSFRLAWGPGTAPVVAGDEKLFADGLSRHLPWVTIASGPVTELGLTFSVDLVPEEEIAAPDLGEMGTNFWAAMAGAFRLSCPADGHASDEVDRMGSIAPWFVHNALVHYLAPRGLEQFTGGAWGTRDVCQGPVGLLVALGQLPALRDVVRRVWRAQRPEGDWPQAFEFLGDVPPADHGEPHGDVVFWPLLALGEYLTISGDGTFLAEMALSGPGPEASAPQPVIDQVRRALDRIGHSTIPGSPLPAYGGGDWNDSLQPVHAHMAARLCSSWTATLQVHALRTLAGALRGSASSLGAGHRAVALACAAQAERLVDGTATALQELLVADDELAGYALFAARGGVEHLVHPSDDRTGLHHGLLQMVHAISADLLTPDQAKAHLAVIEEYLLGPDGAHLFDRPAPYRGGPMEVFRRAEAATFFGREIGLMYTHAHLRYAEALARYGDAEGLFAALALVNPIGMTERVPCARRRQSNCYFSSSDAAFGDRYQAQAGYQQARAGKVGLEGGWRVYSSGPGLYLRLVVESMLGLRLRGERVEIDPVLPHSLDGLQARVPFAGGAIDLTYHVGRSGVGPTAVVLNGVALPTAPLSNPYRARGVSVPFEQLREVLADAPARLDVEVP